MDQLNLCGCTVVRYINAHPSPLFNEILEPIEYPYCLILRLTMRFCLLQSKYTDENILKDHDDYPDPSRFIKDHTYEHRMIDRSDAKAQIDAAVAEDFDFYISFMWGTPEDDVAGADAVEYLESLNVPFVGIPSRMLLKSKTDLYEAARAHGNPPVPGNDANAFPVIVKAARNCASMFLTSKSICFTPEERDAAIAAIDAQLQPGRERSRAGNSPLSATPPSIDNLPSDIIVQQFVQGVDYSIVIIEFGDTPIALNPTIYNYPPADSSNPNRFLTFDIKFSPQLSEHLINRNDDPVLFDKLQKLAVEAYTVNGSIGGSWGNVDIRIQPNGEPVVIEVNPMPAIFLPPNIQFEDPVISESLPGGHRALLNILLASYFMQKNDEKDRARGIAAEYDQIAPKYDSAYLPKSTAEKVLSSLVSRLDFSGSLLDLACGTGIIGRLIREHHEHSAVDGTRNGTRSRHVGVDISPEMAHACEQAGYDECLVGPMQEVLPRISGQFDHIVCYQAIHFVNTFELSLVLSRCFQLALKSVIIGVDEIPDELNTRVRELKPPTSFLISTNHIREIHDFGVPRGWKLALEERHFGWTSPSVGVDVYTTVFHYERVD